PTHAHAPREGQGGYAQPRGESRRRELRAGWPPPFNAQGESPGITSVSYGRFLIQAWLPLSINWFASAPTTDASIATYPRNGTPFHSTSITSWPTSTAARPCHRILRLRATHATSTKDRISAALTR